MDTTPVIQWREQPVSEETKDPPRRPEPVAEPPPPPPGGPHAVPTVGGVGPYTRIARDPDPHDNPETDNELPAETTEPDETETEATKGGPETPSESEPPE